MPYWSALMYVVRTLVLILAVSQPVFAGAHLFHISTVDLSSVQDHHKADDVTPHSHSHQQVSHVDLTLDIPEVSDVSDQPVMTEKLSSQTGNFDQLASSPENPPPIVR
ncbi:MAG: hypothetical protein ACI9DO_000959 [Reinekea sp.]|jgi:hypothetical protein